MPPFGRLVFVVVRLLLLPLLRALWRRQPFELVLLKLLMLRVVAARTVGHPGDKRRQRLMVVLLPPMTGLLPLRPNVRLPNLVLQLCGSLRQHLYGMRVVRTRLVVFTVPPLTPTAPCRFQPAVPQPVPKVPFGFVRPRPFKVTQFVPLYAVAVSNLTAPLQPGVVGCSPSFPRVAVSFYDYLPNYGRLFTRNRDAYLLLGVAVSVLVGTLDAGLRPLLRRLYVAPGFAGFIRLIAL